MVRRDLAISGARMAFGRRAVGADLGLSVGHPQLADSRAARAADARGACAVARDDIPPDAGAAAPPRLVAGARRRVGRAWTAVVEIGSGAGRGGVGQYVGIWLVARSY